jgi:hypothetical protein
MNNSAEIDDNIKTRLLAIARQYETGSVDMNFEKLSGVFVKRQSSDSEDGFGNLDWQRFIPEELRNMWPNLSIETKAAIYIMACYYDYFSDMPV